MADIGHFDDPSGPLEDPVDDNPLPQNDIVNNAAIEASNSLSLQEELTRAKKKLIQEAVDSYYNHLAGKDLVPEARDYTLFEVDDDGRVYLKAFPNLRLVNKNTGEPLALSSLYRNSDAGGPKAIREYLGFSDYKPRKSTLPRKALTAIQTASDELGGEAAAVETIEFKDLGQVADRVSNTVRNMETSLTDSDIQRALETMDDPPLPLREIRGLDKALQTIRGEHVNNLAKLSALDGDIAHEKQKLEEANTEGVDEFSRRRIAERLRNMQDERAARLEAASATREALRSQINRIRETINRILHEDTTLAERIRTLFREQGITVVSIITALGMAISTLVLAITGGGGTPPTPPPKPTDKGGVKEWVKKHLQSLARALGKLAGKAAAALPGIIGSIVSWLLTLLGKTAGWLANNAWALLLAVSGLLFVAARKLMAT